MFSSSVCTLFPFSLQSGLTALHLAAQEDKVHVADILTKHGADEDAHTKVPLTAVIVRALPDLDGPSSPVKPPESTPHSSEGIPSCLRASCPQSCIEAPFLLEPSPAR